jgi:hypothetical protein
VGLIGLVLLAAGCATTGTDVSRDRRFPTDYVVGGVYALKQDRLVERTGTWPATGLVVKPPPQLNVPNAPRSMAEYRAAPQRWPTVAGVMPAGTRVRVLKIVHVGSLQWVGLEAIAEVSGEVLDGPFRGRKVDLTWVSRTVQQHDPPSRMVWVEAAELEPVAGP